MVCLNSACRGSGPWRRRVVLRCRFDLSSSHIQIHSFPLSTSPWMTSPKPAPSHRASGPKGYLTTILIRHLDSSCESSEMPSKLFSVSMHGRLSFTVICHLIWESLFSELSLSWSNDQETANVWTTDQLSLEDCILQFSRRKTHEKWPRKETAERCFQM